MAVLTLDKPTHPPRVTKGTRATPSDAYLERWCRALLAINDNPQEAQSGT